MHRRPLTRALGPCLVLSIVVATAAVVARQQALPLSALLPVDPQVTTGQLPNGLRFYIRSNATPARRAELRLVVNAGSVLEEDSERGLAHFVEHMAFDGTEHFQKGAILQFLQSLGMRPGADVNASTGFDETIYTLQIPTERADVVDKAFLVLEDWAESVTFDPAEIDRERRVIIEEWRLRLGAAARLRDQQSAVLF